MTLSSPTFAWRVFPPCSLHDNYKNPWAILFLGGVSLFNRVCSFLSLCNVYFQEIADARLIRNKILTNFELATQVGTSESERKRLLHFVIVGGGPTGVEFSAELYDFLKQVSAYVSGGGTRGGVCNEGGMGLWGVELVC